MSTTTERAGRPILRRLGRWLLVVLLLVVVLFAGPGWYFAGRIHSDGL